MARNFFEVVGDKCDRLACFNEEARVWLARELNQIFAGCADANLITIASLKSGDLGVVHQIPRKNDMRSLGYGDRIHRALFFKYDDHSLPYREWEKFERIRAVKPDEWWKNFWSLGYLKRRRAKVSDRYEFHEIRKLQRLAEKFDAGELFGPFQCMRDLSCHILTSLVSDDPELGRDMKAEEVDIAFVTKELLDDDQEAPNFLVMSSDYMSQYISGGEQHYGGFGEVAHLPSNDESMQLTN